MKAREFLLSHKHFWPPSVDAVEKVMIEFAQLHVEAALKEASIFAREYEDEQLVLNAYPKELIK